jgi:hypothetical protein
MRISAEWNRIDRKHGYAALFWQSSMAARCPAAIEFG